MNENPTDANEQYKLGCYYEEKSESYTNADKERLKREGCENPLGDATSVNVTSNFVIPNDKKAFYWFTKSAQQGHANAQYKVGYHYLLGGIVCKPNKEKARYWFTKAAEQGNKKAEDELVSLDDTFDQLHRKETSSKNWLITLLLAVFLGIFGGHRFYVGKIGTGVIMLLLSSTGISIIWAIIDIIMIATGKFEDDLGHTIKK